MKTNGDEISHRAKANNEQWQTHRDNSKTTSTSWIWLLISIFEDWPQDAAPGPCRLTETYSWSSLETGHMGARVVLPLPIRGKELGVGLCGLGGGNTQAQGEEVDRQRPVPSSSNTMVHCHRRARNSSAKFQPSNGGKMRSSTPLVHPPWPMP